MLTHVVTRGRNELSVVAIILAMLQVQVDSRRNDQNIQTDKGRIRGVSYYIPQLGKSVEAYLGIPFAKPPVGHLRFKHPEPMDPWRGTYNATKLPNSCYQVPDTEFGEFYGSTMWNPTTRVSEDCLYVNVWVPRLKPRLRHSAVLVWIYGGGFYSGTTTLNLYDGKFLAATNDIIVVSIAYRVGVLGFLSLGHPSAPGNAGMFDQVMGLEWVQRNIAAFGGDPKNVTIFGESAGSVSVSLHLLSPLSRTKFARAIMQSGTANMPWGTVTMDEGKRRSLYLAVKYLRCPETNDMEMILNCLVNIKPQELVESQWVSRGIMQFPFVPVVDGTFLVEAPEVSLKRQSFKKCPILLGSNFNEASFFMIYELTDWLHLNRSVMNREQFLQSIDLLFFHYPQFPETINRFGLEAITFQYTHWLDPDDTDSNINALDEAVSDCHFVCHVNRFANVYSLAGENVYSYFFTERYRSNPWPSWMGVLHGDEINFVFGDPLKPELQDSYTPEERLLSLKMMSYWSNFAKSGDPNRTPLGEYLNEWPLHTPRGKEYLELNSRFLDEPDKSKAVGRGPRTSECAFWDDYLPRLVALTSETPTPTEPPVVVNNYTCAMETSSGAAVWTVDALILGSLILLTPAFL